MFEQPNLSGLIELPLLLVASRRFVFGVPHDEIVQGLNTASLISFLLNHHLALFRLLNMLSQFLNTLSFALLT